MNIKDKLDTIRVYFLTSRQAGHSTLMNVGTNNFNGDKLVLVLDKRHGDEMGLKTSEMVSLDSLHKLRGHNAPLVIDNGVLIEIFDQSLLKYIDLENDARKERIKFNLAMKDLDKARTEIKKMRRQPIRTFFKTIFGTWQH